MMLDQTKAIAGPPPAVHTNGQVPAGRQDRADLKKKRALRKLLRDLIAFSGTAVPPCLRNGPHGSIRS
jgi:hypothetical protein